MKMKLHKMKANVNGKLPYKGILDCFKKTVRREGFFGLWVGLPTYIVRISPHSTTCLLVLDYLQTNFIDSNSKRNISNKKSEYS